MQVTYRTGFRVAQPEDTRTKILKLQEAMFADPRFDPQCKDFPVTHFTAPGMYARQMLIPAGSIIVGKIHKHAHLNQISYGHVRVMTEFGPMEIKGPHTFTSQPGTKRVVYALADTLWTTFHLNPNDLDPESEADMRELEDEIIAKSYEDFEAIASRKDAQHALEAA